MDLKAILLLETQPHGFGLEVFGGAPPAAVDILGRSVVQRTIDRLFTAGSSTVWVVGDSGTQPLAAFRDGYSTGEVHCQPAPGAQLWRMAENAFNEAVSDNAELLIVQRVGAWAEFDYDDLLQFHMDRGHRVTPVNDATGTPLDTFVISASRRNDAAFLFRHQLQQMRTPATPYRFAGYCNLLRDGRDLRRLTVDGLYGACGLKPHGDQVRPGVWLGEGARILPGARVLAPAFLGAYSRVRNTAVVTSFSSVEHHVQVDCGTVVEDSNVLPYTYVGAALDVVHSVAGNRRLLHLKRGAEVEIADPKLLGTVSQHAPMRALASAAALATFLPKQVWRGMFSGKQRECPATLGAAVTTPATALKSPAAKHTTEQPQEFPSSLVIARRYGNE